MSTPGGAAPGEAPPEELPPEEAPVAHGLDHVGVCTRDGPALWTAWERLGFALTPVARHSAPRIPGGPAEPMGTGNRCAMLRHGYVELLAILDPSLPDNGMGARLDRHEGAHILALAVSDADANLARLRRAGLDIPGVALLERPVDDAGGPLARFTRIPLPDAPEGRVQLIRHETPELLWQPRWLDHPNRAVSLDCVILASAEPAASAARLSRLAGLSLEPDPVGGYALLLPRGRVRIIPPAALPDLLPGVAPPALPFLAGLVLGTDDSAAAARRLLAGAATDGPLGLSVPPALAGGAALVFAA